MVVTCRRIVTGYTKIKTILHAPERNVLETIELNFTGRLRRFNSTFHTKRGRGELLDNTQTHQPKKT